MSHPGGPAAWPPPPPPTSPASPVFPIPTPAAGPGPGSGPGSSTTALVVLLALLVGGLIGGGAMSLSADDEDDDGGAAAGLPGSAPTATTVPTDADAEQGEPGEGAGTGARIPDHPPAVEGAHGVLLAYTEAVVDGDCETMIGLMSEGFVSAAGDPEQAVIECESVIGMASSVEIDRFDLVSDDPDRVVYEVTSTHAGETYVEEFVMVLENGLWFVDSIA